MASLEVLWHKSDHPLELPVPILTDKIRPSIAKVALADSLSASAPLPQATLLEQARDYTLTGGGSGYIIRGGKLVFSSGDPDLRYSLKSITKSYAWPCPAGRPDRAGTVTSTEPSQEPIAGTGLRLPPRFCISPTTEPASVRAAATSACCWKPAALGPIATAGGTGWPTLLTIRFGRDVRELMAAPVFKPLGASAADHPWRRQEYRYGKIGLVRSSARSTRCCVEMMHFPVLSANCAPRHRKGETSHVSLRVHQVSRRRKRADAFGQVRRGYL
jgi:hypothetical protein